jgi:hypothetical protein
MVVQTMVVRGGCLFPIFFHRWAGNDAFARQPSSRFPHDHPAAPNGGMLEEVVAQLDNLVLVETRRGRMEGLALLSDLR